MDRRLGRWKSVAVFLFIACSVLVNATEEMEKSAVTENTLSTSSQQSTTSQTTTSSTVRPSEGSGKESYHMPGYLIAVIVLAIFLFTVMSFKIYRNFCRDEIKLPCCKRRMSHRGLSRRDTNKPLIRGSVSSQSGSIYKKGNQQNQAEMV